MTRLTVTINNDSNAALLIQMLESISFVKKVEKENFNELELTKDEIQLLEKRWAAYKKNPKQVKTWDKVKNEIEKKYEL